MTERLLGIDIGTTGVRVAVFEPTGALVADASIPCAPLSPQPGWAEAPPDAWWTSVVSALVDVATRTRLADVAAICVTGQAPTAVLVDDAGASIRNAILWLDVRAEAEARELGVPSYYLGPKLLWLARHEKLRAHTVLQSHAFIAFRLTGEAATDPSTAALCRPLFDLAKKAWVHDARIPAKLPPIRAAHDVIGAVTAGAAKVTGLREGTPVVAGGGDFAAATLGAGVVEEGEACLMLGTAGNLLVPRKTPGNDPRLIESHHVGADRWLSLGGTLSGGAQEWLRHALARGATVSEDDDTGVRDALAPFEVLDAEAARVPAGSDGLLFLPSLQGDRTPTWDAEARGAYVGLGLQHGRGHLWRALLEGIALGFVDCQAVVEESGVRFREVVAANGGGKSALFRQILCDALGVPLLYAPGAGGTVAGAAMLAALGAKVLGSAEDARVFRGRIVRHEPDRAAHARYRELLALRRAACGGLKPVFAGLAPFRA
jgi:xylulokinase